MFQTFDHLRRMVPRGRADVRSTSPMHRDWLAQSLRESISMLLFGSDYKAEWIDHYRKES